MVSSHSPSMVVNMASVRFGSPLSRTTRTASATTSPTPSPIPSGVTENATSTAFSSRPTRSRPFYSERTMLRAPGTRAVPPRGFRPGEWPTARSRPHNDGMVVAADPWITESPGPEPGPEDSLLTVSGLSVSFGHVRALDGVNLSVRTGELVALAGENGAGKTTLVRCIAGDVVPATGEVFLAGRRVPAHSAGAVKQGIAVVWQDLALCDNLDVAANIMLGRESRRLMWSETRLHTAAASLLASLQIPLRDTTRIVGSLSGGQRQLVAVAR